MLRHFLVAALRRLDRHRLTAAINVGALALAFAAALLIATHVSDELSFDRWIPGHERVHRIVMALELGNTQEPASRYARRADNFARSVRRAGPPVR